MMKRMRKQWAMLLFIVGMAAMTLMDASVVHAAKDEEAGYTLTATEYTCAECGQATEGVSSVGIKDLQRNGAKVTLQISLSVSCGNPNCDFNDSWTSQRQTFISENGCTGEFRSTRNVSGWNWQIGSDCVTFTLTGPADPYVTHDFSGDVDRFEDEKHYHVCNNEGCNVADEGVSHAGGTASFYEAAVCEGCQQHYGEKLKNTENTAKVTDINATNVSMADKENLSKAKADYEKALNEYTDNYTEEEKAAIQGKLGEIDNALAVIKTVEDIEALINTLPEITEHAFENEKDIQKVENVNAIYIALSDYEKTLVNEETRGKLNAAMMAVKDYKLSEDNGDTEGQEEKENPEEEENSEGKENLEEKENPEEKENSEEKGNPEGNKPSEVTTESSPKVNTDKSPETGDNVNSLLLYSMLSISGMEIALLTICSKERIVGK